MAQYVIVYLGGDKPASPEDGKKHFAKYQDWLASLGASAVSPMNPLKNTNAIASDGSITEGSTIKMSGYTIIEANGAEAALQMAKRCPFLDVGGTIEVSELMQVPG